MSAFDVWQDPSSKAVFAFSHSSHEFTTGVMTLKSGAELPKHNRPAAYENLLQISGKCKMTLLDEGGEVIEEHVLEPGDFLKMDKGQWHVHANPYDEDSATLFKAEGDITSIVAALKDSFTNLPLSE